MSKKEVVVKKLGANHKEFNLDVLHLLAREAYTIALIEDGRRLPSKEMTPAKIDLYCGMYKPRLRTFLQVLQQHGYIAENLELPKNVPSKAVDCGIDGISSWVKKRYLPAKTE